MSRNHLFGPLCCGPSSHRAVSGHFRQSARQGESWGNIFVINLGRFGFNLIGSSLMNEDQTDLAGSFLAVLRPIRRELEVYCRRLVWNEHDASDAIQNAVMNAFKAFDRYHDNSNFRAWMLKILTHESFKLNQKYG